MASNVRDIPAGDLTTEQVTLLVRQFTAMHAGLSEVPAIMGRYAAAGGRDYETWDRILDGAGRCSTRLMQNSGDPIHPDWPAAAAVGRLAGRGDPPHPRPGAAHDRVAGRPALSDQPGRPS